MRSVLALTAVLLSGCVAPVQAARDLPQAQTLAEVNALLDGRLVDIELMDGARISGVREAAVTLHDVRFERAGQPQAVAIDDVEQIVLADGRGGGGGVLVGLASGGAVVGLGAALITVSEPGGPSQKLGVLVLVNGALLTIPAAVIGGVLGRRIQPDSSPFYRAPLDRYLAAPSVERP